MKHFPDYYRPAFLNQTPIWGKWNYDYLLAFAVNHYFFILFNIQQPPSPNSGGKI